MRIIVYKKIYKWSGINATSYDIKEGRDKDKIIKEFENGIKIALAMSATCAYVCRGNEEFLYKVPLADVPTLLGYMGYNLNFPKKFSPENISIDSALFVAIYHLSKNALVHGCVNEAELEVCEESGNGYSIFFRDEGKGMPRIQLAMIHRDLNQNKVEGLGLEIVKRVINLRNGYIKVVSNYNNTTYEASKDYGLIQLDENVHKGTTFQLHIPFDRI